MSLFDWFADRRKGQYVGKVNQEPDEGDGLWSKCPECGQVVYRKDLPTNASLGGYCCHLNVFDSSGFKGLSLSCPYFFCATGQDCLQLSIAQLNRKK